MNVRTIPPIWKSARTACHTTSVLGFESIDLPSFEAPFVGEPQQSTCGIEIGTALHERKPVVLTDADLRHGTLVAGRTGVGKSKLAEWILRQLLIRRSTRAHSGSTFVFDPHWSLAGDVIDFAVACNLDIPILTIDPAADPLVAYDPIRSNPHLPPGVVADLFSKWMAHAWRRSDDDATPLLESNIKLIIRTLLDAKLTLVQASTLIDPDAPTPLRAGIVSQVRDPILRTKWSRLLGMSAGAFLSHVGSAARALARLPEQANLLLGQPTSFGFRQAMDEGWFVFIRTSGEDGVGPTLASIMLDDLWNTVRSRGKGQPPVHVVIDEFTQLCGPHTVEMLNGGRKFDIRLLLLMQSARQLKHLGASGRQAFDEVMLNCLNKVCMAVDSASASAIADELGTSTQRLTKLSRMHAMAHTMSMPPGVSVEIASRMMMPMCVSLQQRIEYLTDSIKASNIRHAYSRADAIAHLLRSHSSQDSGAVSDVPIISDEPDEFTRVIRGNQ
jgi:hypothetical protein